MNKKLIAAAVSAAVVAPVASHADAVLYGRINNAIDLKDIDPDGDGTTDHSTVASRIGVRANADVGSGLSAHGHYEFSTVTDKEGGGIGDTRVATVGISGDFGRFDLGNQWSAYNETFGTLVSPTYSLGYYLYSSVGGGLFRASNTIQYSNSFGPVTARLDVRLNDSDEGDDVAEKVSGNGIALGLSFAVTDNITIAAAFDSEDGADDQSAVTARKAIVSADYNPGNEERRGAVTVDVQAADGTLTETTFVAVTEAGTSGGNIGEAPVTTAVAADGEVRTEAVSGLAAGDNPGTDRVGVAVKANFGGYWATLGWQNYSVDENERSGKAEVDVDTLFLYGGGNFSEQTSWLVGYSSADDGVDASGMDVAGVGSATAGAGVAGSIATAETDDSTQLTVGIYHNVGNGLRLYYEGASLDSENKNWDGARHLLGMRIDF